MKINELWLKEMVETNATADVIGAQLTMAGLELDALEPAAGDFSDVVVAEITSIEAHPDADKLRVCQVSNGKDSWQVVCGAANARTGLKTALAQVGASLPNGMAIKKAKLRGVESSGMLCSASELGIDDDADGIMELPEDADLGTALSEYLQLEDQVLDLDLTPNRADCFSVLGVARDLAAIQESGFSEPVVDEVAATITTEFPVNSSAPELCPIYFGRVIENVDTTAVTPLWLKERLRRCGLRSLGPVVDVTNYVMLELGQPMHAFDLDTLKEGIDVRLAEKNEKLELLDGNTITLQNDTLVIADGSGPVALAGIMGGLPTSVTTKANNIFLECAFFNPRAITGKARKYGLHTDSSMRYERGVDFTQQQRAIERATQLILEICGGSAGPVNKVFTEEHLEAIKPIVLKFSDLNQRLGIDLNPDTVIKMLSRLGCDVEAADDSCTVTPPAWRFDLRIPVDLIEEVARLYGYDNIPLLTSHWNSEITSTDEATLNINQLREVLIANGFYEAITYSFIDEKTEKSLATGFTPVALLNPISSDLSQMRTTLIGGLLNTCLYNLRRQQNDLKFFETGLVFQETEQGLLQTRKLALVITGAKNTEHWDNTSRPVDFFDLKGSIECLLELNSEERHYHWQRSDNEMLHPGQSASITVDNKTVGYFGALHPSILKKFGFKQDVYVAELDLTFLLEGSISRFEALSKYPSVRRDLAIVVDEVTSYDDLVKTIQATDIEILRSSHIFDLYTGEGVKKGLKSIALGLILQDFSRTLAEQEIESVVAKITAKLQQDLQATIRE